MPAFDAMLTIEPPPVEEVRQRGLADEEGAGEVDADDALPVGERHLVRVGEPADAGAVHDDRGPAEVARHARHRALHRVGVGDVDAVRTRRGSGFADLGRRLLRRVDRDVEARDRARLRSPVVAPSRARDPTPRPSPLLLVHQSVPCAETNAPKNKAFQKGCRTKRRPAGRTGGPSARLLPLGGGSREAVPAGIIGGTRCGMSNRATPRDSAAGYSGKRPAKPPSR